MKIEVKEHLINIMFNNNAHVSNQQKRFNGNVEDIIVTYSGAFMNFTKQRCYNKYNTKAISATSISELYIFCVYPNIHLKKKYSSYIVESNYQIVMSQRQVLIINLFVIFFLLEIRKYIKEILLHFIKNFFLFFVKTYLLIFCNWSSFSVFSHISYIHLLLHNDSWDTFNFTKYVLFFNCVQKFNSNVVSLKYKNNHILKSIKNKDNEKKNHIIQYKNSSCALIIFLLSIRGRKDEKIKNALFYYIEENNYTKFDKNRIIEKNNHIKIKMIMIIKVTITEIIIIYYVSLVENILFLCIPIIKNVHHLLYHHKNTKLFNTQEYLPVEREMRIINKCGKAFLTNFSQILHFFLCVAIQHYIPPDGHQFARHFKLDSIIHFLILKVVLHSQNHFKINVSYEHTFITLQLIAYLTEICKKDFLFFATKVFCMIKNLKEGRMPFSVERRNNKISKKGNNNCNHSNSSGKNNNIGNNNIGNNNIGNNNIGNNNIGNNNIGNNNIGNNNIDNNNIGNNNIGNNNIGNNNIGNNNRNNMSIYMNCERKVRYEEMFNLSKNRHSYFRNQYRQSGKVGKRTCMNMIRVKNGKLAKKFMCEMTLKNSLEYKSKGEIRNSEEYSGRNDHNSNTYSREGNEHNHRRGSRDSGQNSEKGSGSEQDSNSKKSNGNENNYNNSGNNNNKNSNSSGGNNNNSEGNDNDNSNNNDEDNKNNKGEDDFVGDDKSNDERSNNDNDNNEDINVEGNNNKGEINVNGNENKDAEGINNVDAGNSTANCKSSSRSRSNNNNITSCNDNICNQSNVNITDEGRTISSSNKICDESDNSTKEHKQNGEDKEKKNLKITKRMLKNLSFMSFNTGLLEYKICGICIYQNPPFISSRLLHIPFALKKTNADIIALQEVYDEKHVEYLKSNLNSSYPFCARDNYCSDIFMNKFIGANKVDGNEENGPRSNIVEGSNKQGGKGDDKNDEKSYSKNDGKSYSKNDGKSYSKNDRKSDVKSSDIGDDKCSNSSIINNACKRNSLNYCKNGGKRNNPNISNANMNSRSGVQRKEKNCKKKKYFALHHGLLVFSKYPIIYSYFHQFKHVTYLENLFGTKGFLEVVIDVPFFSYITLVNMHLASGAVDTESKYIEKVRDFEIKQIMKIARNAEKRNTIPIIIGDLNAAPNLCPNNYSSFIKRGWKDAWLYARNVKKKKIKQVLAKPLRQLKRSKTPVISPNLYNQFDCLLPADNKQIGYEFVYESGGNDVDKRIYSLNKSDDSASKYGNKIGNKNGSKIGNKTDGYGTNEGCIYLDSGSSDHDNSNIDCCQCALKSIYLENSREKKENRKNNKSINNNSTAIFLGKKRSNNNSEENYNSEKIVKSGENYNSTFYANSAKLLCNNCKNPHFLNLCNDDSKQLRKSVKKCELHENNIVSPITYLETNNFKPCAMKFESSSVNNDNSMNSNNNNVNNTIKTGTYMHFKKLKNGFCVVCHYKNKEKSNENSNTCFLGTSLCICNNSRAIKTIVKIKKKKRKYFNHINVKKKKDINNCSKSNPIKNFVSHFSKNNDFPNYDIKSGKRNLHATSTFCVAKLDEEKEGCFPSSDIKYKGYDSEDIKNISTDVINTCTCISSSYTDISKNCLDIRNSNNYTSVDYIKKGKDICMRSIPNIKNETRPSNICGNIHQKNDSIRTQKNIQRCSTCDIIKWDTKLNNNIVYNKISLFKNNEKRNTSNEVMTKYYEQSDYCAGKKEEYYNNFKNCTNNNSDYNLYSSDISSDSNRSYTDLYDDEEEEVEEGEEDMNDLSDTNWNSSRCFISKVDYTNNKKGLVSEVEKGYTYSDATNRVIRKNKENDILNGEVFVKNEHNGNMRRDLTDDVPITEKSGVLGNHEIKNEDHYKCHYKECYKGRFRDITNSLCCDSYKEGNTTLTHIYNENPQNGIYSEKIKKIEKNNSRLNKSSSHDEGQEGVNYIRTNYQDKEKRKTSFFLSKEQEEQEQVQQEQRNEKTEFVLPRKVDGYNGKDDDNVVSHADCSDNNKVEDVNKCITNTDSINEDINVVISTSNATNDANEENASVNTNKKKKKISKFAKKMKYIKKKIFCKFMRSYGRSHYHKGEKRLEIKEDKKYTYYKKGEKGNDQKSALFCTVNGEVQDGQTVYPQEKEASNVMRNDEIDPFNNNKNRRNINEQSKKNASCNNFLYFTKKWYNHNSEQVLKKDIFYFIKKLKFKITEMLRHTFNIYENNSKNSMSDEEQFLLCEKEGKHEEQPTQNDRNYVENFHTHKSPGSILASSTLERNGLASSGVTSSKLSNSKLGRNFTKTCDYCVPQNESPKNNKKENIFRRGQKKSMCNYFFRRSKKGEQWFGRNLMKEKNNFHKEKKFNIFQSTGRGDIYHNNLYEKINLKKKNKIFFNVQKDDSLSCDEFTWDPLNPLNLIGPHSRCNGLRCDYIFFPPINYRKDKNNKQNKEDNIKVQKNSNIKMSYNEHLIRSDKNLKTNALPYGQDSKEGDDHAHSGFVWKLHSRSDKGSKWNSGKINSRNCSNKEKPEQRNIKKYGDLKILKHYYIKSAKILFNEPSVMIHSHRYYQNFNCCYSFCMKIRNVHFVTMSDHYAIKIDLRLKKNHQLV
ncbi:hypothetical protein MKS88_001849 [Plasmodium brasilianum]|uniref:Uncharacterized protein n=1 Tax=Plasmodium brasilianum TaxID=5824 RepID=A0ACB9YCF9_PLABR|nr:hypothetical protein MKS88_001849 [Plasmodium brasilianum]